MITVFGEYNDDYKPVIRNGVKLPGYYATRDGRIYSAKTNKFISLYTSSPSKNKFYYACSLSLPKGIFSKKGSGTEHEFFVPSWKKTTFNLKIEVHRLIAETFIPIDENPPIPMEDWINTPETAKQFIRDSALVDHIDDDSSNNHADNLRWVTPKQNNLHRKKQELELIKCKSNENMDVSKS